MNRIKRLLPYLPLTLLIVFAIWHFWGDFIKWRNGPISPREENGIHYLHTDDSIYRIKFIIDSVWEKEYEPKDDPR